LYRLLLQLYPEDFRALFADEMLNVFAEALNDAKPCNQLLLGVILPVVARVVTDKFLYVFYGAILLIVVMLPALLERLPRSNRTASNS
jgi:hypothetical protein